MKNELKNNLAYRKTMLILSALCITSGLLSLILGEVVIPIASALLAAIILFENKEKRRFSYICAISLLVINALTFIPPLQVISFWSIITVLFAVIISYAYRRPIRKSECALILTLLAVIILTLPLILTAMIACGEYSITAVISYYEDMFAVMREEFVVYVNELIAELSYSAGELPIDADWYIKVYDYQVNMLISYLIISAFALVGFSLKCFSAIVKKCAENTAQINSWRFWTDNIFAYFYFLLAIVSLFISAPDTVFAVTVLNLYNIFMFIYFYVGFTVAREFFSHGRRPVLSTVLLILGILMFNAYAIELLAVIGAFFTIRTNNERPIAKD